MELIENKYFKIIRISLLLVVFFNSIDANIIAIAKDPTSSSAELPAITSLPISSCLNCTLPDCLRPSFSTPLGLKLQKTPQLVLLTFDDAIEDWMYPFYEKIIKHEGLKSSNGCPISMTFFVSHTHKENDRQVGITNYELVNRLYNGGHEIAPHTVTHFPDMDYWRRGPFERWIKEIETQRDFLATFANIPKENIKGFRAPFLEVNGDSTYTALQTLGMTYDSSLFSTYKNPPLWPFTMDDGNPMNLSGINLPKRKFKGIWEFPLTVFSDLEGPGVCKMPDFECKRPTNSSMAFNFFMKQFMSFNSTRTLFGIYQHAYWFRDSPHMFEGFLQFLEYLSGLEDVYFVTMSQALEWMKNPMTTAQLKSDKYRQPFACQARRPQMACQPKNCDYWDSPLPNPGRVKNFTACISTCPKYFPLFPVNGCESNNYWCWFFLLPLFYFWY